MIIRVSEARRGGWVTPLPGAHIHPGTKLEAGGTAIGVYVTSDRDVTVLPCGAGLPATVSSREFFSPPPDVAVRVKSHPQRARHGLVVDNGLYDLDGRGHVGLTLINVSPGPVRVTRGSPVAEVWFERVEPKHKLTDMSKVDLSQLEARILGLPPEPREDDMYARLAKKHGVTRAAVKSAAYSIAYGPVGCPPDPTLEEIIDAYLTRVLAR